MAETHTTASLAPAATERPRGGQGETAMAETRLKQIGGLLARQGLRASGGDGSDMAVEDAVSAQFAADITEFAKPTLERFRRTRHSAQYFDPDAAPITDSDASWAIEKATAAVSGVQALLAASSPPERLS